MIVLVMVLLTVSPILMGTRWKSITKLSGTNRRKNLRPALKNQASRFPDNGIGLRRIDHINLLAADVRLNRIFMQEALGGRMTEQMIFDDGSEKASWLTLYEQNLRCGDF